MYQCLRLHDFKTGIFVSSKGADGYILSRQIATVWLHEMVSSLQLIACRKAVQKVS